MCYLVICYGEDCVDYNSFIGFASDKIGLQEILFEYHKYIFSSNIEEIFETKYINNDIQIYKINKENYDYLNEIAYKYDQEILIHYETLYKNMDYFPSNRFSNFLFIDMVNDENDYSIFNKDIHEKYYEIINNSELLV